MGILVDISNGSRIEGNYAGTDKSGTKDLGNAEGVLVQNTPAGATIGGTTAASRNVISGNDEPASPSSTRRGPRRSATA